MTHFCFLVSDSHERIRGDASEGAHSVFQPPETLMMVAGASGVTATQSAEKAAKGSGEEIQACKNIEQPDMVLLSSVKDVQRTAEISASKQISTEATRSPSPLKADSKSASKGNQDHHATT